MAALVRIVVGLMPGEHRQCQKRVIWIKSNPVFLLAWEWLHLYSRECRNSMGFMVFWAKLLITILWVNIKEIYD